MHLSIVLCSSPDSASKRLQKAAEGKAQAAPSSDVGFSQGFKEETSFKIPGMARRGDGVSDAALASGKQRRDDEGGQMDAPCSSGAGQGPAEASRQGAAKSSSDEMVALTAQLGAFKSVMVIKDAELAAQREEIERLQIALERARGKLAEATAAAARRADDGARFHFVLAGTGQAGSIPRSFLASEPDSLLNKMYNGEWDYARDDQGGALINCHPDRWAAILEHLSTGTVPRVVDQQLLDQARHWNLLRLVQAIEDSTPGVTATNHSDGKSCTVRCTFTSVMKSLREGEPLRLTFCFLRKQLYFLDVTPQGIGISASARGYHSHPKAEANIKVLLWGEVLEQSIKDIKENSPWNLEVNFDAWGFSCHELVTEPLALTHDQLLVEVDMCLIQ